MNTFITGPPYNANKNSKNINDELGYYNLQKLQKYRTNSIGKNENSNFDEQ